MAMLKPVKRMAQIVLGFRPGTLFLDLDNTLFREPCTTRTPTLCDPYAPGWVMLARNAGWRVAGCTARSPSLAAFTQTQLNSVHVALDPVLYTDGNAKGPVVAQYLMRHGVLTDPVVVVDDQKAQLENIYECITYLLPHIQLRMYQFCS